MAKLICIICLSLLMPGIVEAQVSVPAPTPSSYRLAWDHTGANVDGFALYIDSARQDLGPVIPVVGVYSIAFPALTPGVHTLEVRAYNLAGESGPATLLVTVVVIPADPGNLRIIVIPQP